MNRHSDDCDSCARNLIDGPSWGPGPWRDEPNRVQFEHVGLPCILHRNGMGAWCGYVGISPGHLLHGMGYSEAESRFNIDVHGGLTYAEECAGHICHVPKPGEPDNLWWFGFDCAHAWDMVPGMNATRRKYGIQSAFEEHYWTEAEVRAETQRLAEQLASIGRVTPEQRAMQAAFARE